MCCNDKRDELSIRERSSMHDGRVALSRLARRAEYSRSDGHVRRILTGVSIGVYSREFVARGLALFFILLFVVGAGYISEIRVILGGLYATLVCLSAGDRVVAVSFLREVVLIIYILL